VTVTTVLEELEGHIVLDFSGLLVISGVADLAGVGEILASKLSEGFDDCILLTEIVRDEDCVLLVLGDAV
jgi:hypothetical protein